MRGEVDIFVKLRKGKTGKEKERERDKSWRVVGGWGIKRKQESNLN